MNRYILSHLRHHGRFYASVLIGISLYFLLPGLPWAIRLMAAGDGFFAVYLVAMMLLVADITAKDLCEKAAEEDEGIFIVLILVLTVIGINCASIVTVLNSRHGPSAVPFLLALAGAPLGWFTLHTIAAFHYANLYYQRRSDGSAIRGLQFPGSEEPGIWDFLYYAFVVGMTAQVSDVQVLTVKLRRATLGHSLVSFFFNTAIIAMAVNVVVTVAS